MEEEEYVKDSAASVHNRNKELPAYKLDEKQQIETSWIISYKRTDKTTTLYKTANGLREKGNSGRSS